ncbi:uncharacterized protein LOC117651715 [Thrips palmi]|uniref:Uncharacterized protein LOC117651715 n=1 Tax=Thrips palmi TaxID=161013 RepID=A0A6P9A258_THRPL|nr:uncharacterized protein LOC117651715 [Thrips palmi]
MPPLPSIMIWTILAPLLTFDHVRSKRLNTFAGPFIAYAHAWDLCPSDGSIEMTLRSSHFNPLKPSERQTVSGNVSFKIDYTDQFWSHADLALRSNNQWKENAFLFQFRKMGCSGIRDQIPDFFRVLAKHSGASMDRREPCVLPAGHYILKNEPVNWTFPNFPVMPYGRYRLRIRSRTARDSPVTRFCILVDCEVIPKP